MPAKPKPPSAKAKATAGRHSARKLPVNQWAKAPAKQCRECLQDTRSLEKDIAGDEKAWLKWVKSRYNVSLGLDCPSGSSCYYCILTRIDWFPEHGLDELLQLRKTSSELDARWQEIRRGKVSNQSDPSYEKGFPGV